MAGRILLVDNKPEVLTQWRRLLEHEGYVVFTASTPDEARATIGSARIHVAMIDIRLISDRDVNDFSGLDLAEWMPSEVGKIILTAFPTVETTRRAYSQVYPGRTSPPVFHYATTDDSPDQILNAIRLCFETHIRINFSLAVELTAAEGQPSMANEAAFESLLEELSLSHPDVLDRPQLSDELREVFGRLFFSNRSVVLTLLSERGYSQTAVVQATADDQAPVVVKFGRRKSIEKEFRNYSNHVAPFLTFRSTICQPPAFGKHFGGIIYTLVGTDLDKVVSFRSSFRAASAKQISQVVRRLIRDTCSHWYAGRPIDGRQRLPLHELYRTQVGLTQTKIEAAMRKEFPEYYGRKLIEFPPLTESFPNPVDWMKGREFLFVVNRCRTHGDLNGKNIFVDQDRHSWLIDFFRTDIGHALRDLIAIEADIKFNILETSIIPSLHEFELSLARPRRFGDPLVYSTRGKTTDLAKAVHVIREIRRLAAEIAAPSTDAREYYAGLFYYTLNMIRYPNVYKERKRHALLSAAILAKRMDAWKR